MTRGCHARIKSDTGRCVLTLLAIIILLRAIVPVGFMPDLSQLANGVFEVVICSGDGLSTITVDGDGNPVAPHGSDTGPVEDGLCPFAVAAAVALAALAVLLFASFRWPSRVVFSVHQAQWASVHCSGPIGARAPPLF